MLAPRIEGAKFVDLYAGSGAVGIEAISRGAEVVWFAESAPAAVKAIRENLAALKVVSEYAIESRGSTVLLDELVKRGEIRIRRVGGPTRGRVLFSRTELQRFAEVTETSKR